MFIVDSNHEIQIKMKKTTTTPPSNCQLLPLLLWHGKLMKVAETDDLVMCLWHWKLVTVVLESFWQDVSVVIKTCFPLSLVIPFLGISPKEINQTMQRFIATLFIVGNNRKISTYSTVKKLSKLKISTEFQFLVVI